MSPYRAPTFRATPAPPARSWRAWLKFQFAPPLFTRCPYCGTRTCPHANAVSYLMLAYMMMGAGAVLYWILRSV